MSNEETPLPQLQPNTPKKRKGRPKGSKNKRPSRRRRLLDIAAVDVAFEAAFGVVPPTAQPSQPTPSPQQHHSSNHLYHRFKFGVFVKIWKGLSESQRSMIRPT